MRPLWLAALLACHSAVAAAIDSTDCPLSHPRSLTAADNQTVAVCSDGCDCTRLPTQLSCVNVDFEDVQPLLTASLQIVHLVDVDFDDDMMPARAFVNMSALRELHLIDCDIEYVEAFGNRTESPIEGVLTKLVLYDNDIEEYWTLTRLMQWWPTLQHVDLSYNELSELDIEVPEEQFHRITSALRLLNLSESELEQLPRIPHSVQVLDISKNEFTHLPGSHLPANLRHLNASTNSLSEVTNQTFANTTLLQTLNLRHNKISLLHNQAFAGLQQLSTLDLSHNEVAITWQPTLHNSMQHLNLSNNQLLYFNFTQLSHLHQLRVVDISHNHELRQIIGSLSDVFHAGTTQLTIDLRFCDLIGLPRYFFQLPAQLQSKEPKPLTLLAGNKLACDCQLLWLAHRDSFPTIQEEQSLQCYNESNEESTPRTFINESLLSTLNVTAENCQLGFSAANNSIRRFKYGTRALVHCEVYSEQPVSIQWHVVHPGHVIGEWHDANDTAVVHIDEATEDADGQPVQKFSILPGGTLVIQRMTPQDIERYICTVTPTMSRTKRSAEDNGTQSQSLLIKVRIDYSHYVDTELWSYVIAVITCMIFFTLHMIWSGLRRFILWRMEVSERASRLKGVAAAMERYRQRQIEAIQDKYARRMEIVRENYRLRAEGLRKRYEHQSERFRDYRVTRKEAMTTHWDNLKDNYQLQMTHMRENYAAQVGGLRDYGSRQMERLWEGYERQVNRVRTFSLQHRLKLMRQYKIKGRYMNKLLEGIHYDDTKLPRTVVELPHMPKLDTPPLGPLRVRRASCNDMDDMQSESEDEDDLMPSVFVRRVASSVSHRHVMPRPAHCSRPTMALSSYHSLPTLDQLMMHMIVPEQDDEDLFYEYEDDDFDVDAVDLLDGTTPASIMAFDRPSTSSSRPKSAGQSTMFTANSFVSISDDPDVRMPLTFFDPDGRRVERDKRRQPNEAYSDTIVKMGNTAV